jgi:hypothetical protein
MKAIKKERTLEQEAKAVEKTIFTVSKIISMVPVMENFTFFNKKQFNESGLQDLIKHLCQENEVSVDHVKKVAGWK